MVETREGNEGERQRHDSTNLESLGEIAHELLGLFGIERSRVLGIIRGPQSFDLGAADRALRMDAELLEGAVRVALLRE